MSRLYNIVTQLSGQRNNISIPRPFVAFCNGDYNLAAVLSQLVFLSGLGMRDDGWFWKKHEELGDELGLTVDQVRYAIKKLKILLGDALEITRKKANGNPTSHYRFNSEMLVDLLFPEQKNGSEKATGKIPDSIREPLPIRNGKIPDSKRENSRNLGTGKIPDSITDPNTNKQINNNSMSENSDELSAEENKIIRPDAEISTPKGDKHGTADDLKAAHWIFDKIVALGGEPKEPNWVSWANEIRLMRERDGRTHREICELFRWANEDPFWCANILSPAKLRSKWNELVIKSRVVKQAKKELNWDDTSWFEEIADRVGGIV